MYIYAIHLRRFRSFSKLTIYPNQKLNILLGPNNSGKSSILRALDLALNPSYHPFLEDLIGTFDFCDGDTSRQLEVWVLLRMEDSDSGDLCDKVSRWLLAKDSSDLLEPTTQNGYSDGLPFDPAIKRPMEEEVLGPQAGGVIELLAVRFLAEWIEEKGAFDLSWEVVDEVGEATAFTQADRRKVGFTLIPTHRDPAQMLGFTRRSLLGKEVENIELSGSLRHIIGQMDRLKTSLVQTDSMKKTLGAVKSAASEFCLFDAHEDFEATVTFLTTEIGRLRTAMELAFRMGLKKGDQGIVVAGGIEDTNDRKSLLPLSYHGDGMQNALLLASLSSKKAERPQSIEAIEEPEQSLEPWRIRSLMTKVSSGSRSQLFLTTHSPAAVGEIGGADNLLVLAPTQNVRAAKHSNFEVIHGSRLSFPTKKEFEKARDIYARCLFSRLVLIIEGSSETGYLPVSLRAAAKKRGGPDLFSLGLELFENFDSNSNMEARAERLGSFGRRACVLLDYDQAKKPEKITTEDRLKKCCTKAVSSFVWSCDSILNGVLGCDLEIVLAATTPVKKLAQAVKEIYEDPGHDVVEKRWESAYATGVLTDLPPDILRRMPNRFPDPSSFSFCEIEEHLARLVLYGLMHEPHSFKSARDMRRLAELLDDAVPEPVLNLYDKLKELLETETEVTKPGYWNLYKRNFVEISTT